MPKTRSPSPDSAPRNRVIRVLRPAFPRPFRRNARPMALWRVAAFAPSMLAWSGGRGRLV